MTVSGAEPLAALLARQRARRATTGPTTAADRRAKLDRLARAIAVRRGEVAEALHADFGKPAAEVEITEVQPVLREIRHVRRHLARWMKPVRVGTPLILFGTRSEIRYEPKGVVLIIAPWNYPFYLALMPLVAAVAAGNSVILKPSEKVPGSSAALARVVADAFDEGEVAVIQGEATVAAALVDLPFDHIFFTGSGRTGRRVLAAAAAHLTPVTLELGGKSPAIVDESADVARAAERIVWGKFLNAGRTCVAPDYVYVHESCAPAFLAEAKRALAAFYGPTEDARRYTPDYCRIVDADGWDRLRRLLDDAVRRGARVEAGGRADAAERYLAPTILSHVPADAAIMEEEIFGPLLPVLVYRSLDDALRFVASQGKPLALYLFSRDRARIAEVLDRTAAGGTVVNNTVLHLANPYLPFGGVGESGSGSYHGRFGFVTLSHQRAVLTQRRPDLIRLFFPPYGPKVRRILAWVDRLLS